MVNNKLKVGLGLLTVLATPIAVDVVAGSEVYAAEQTTTVVVEKSATAEKPATENKQNLAEKSVIENKQNLTEKPVTENKQNVEEKSSVTEKSEVAEKLAEGKVESDKKVDVTNKVVTDKEKKADDKKEDIAYREVPVKKDKTEEKKVGWTQTGNVWYYFNDKGQQVKNAWVGSYWLGSDGRMVTDSWVDGGKYYVGSQGWWVKDAVKKTGWTQTGNTWYLYDNQGNLVKNAWSGNYWLGSDGKMVTDSWVDGGKYYVGSDGKWVKDAKRATDDEKPIEDKKSDTKKTGWVQTGSVWYYYNNQGELTKNAWVGSYWVGSDGKMVTNSWVDGGKYYVGNEGWYIPNYKLSAPAVDMPQYYQSDARWGRKVYGIANMTSAGCVPTALAMAFSGLGKHVTPVNVADVIYYNTKEFNKYGIGTSGAGADYAIKYYNFKNTVIKSKEQLVQALHTGNPVFALVGKGDFVNSYAYTHGIMLSGYQNGKTKAMDPASAYNTNKWYNVDRIWNQRSTDPYDTMLGGSFMLIEKK